MRIRDWSSDVCSSDMIGVGRTRDVGRLRIGSSVEQVALHLEWRLAPQGVEFGFVRAVKFADDLPALDERDVGLNEPIPLCLSRFCAVVEQLLASSLIAGVPLCFGHEGIAFANY